MICMNEISLKPIGFIHNNLGQRRFNQWSDTESELVIDREYTDALYGLTDYSHIEVLFYLHEMKHPFRSLIHPTGNPEYPKMGAFATRTPNRPCRIGLTTCALLSLDDNIIRVRGLDAYDGSPILDIKPYSGKTIESIKIPQWIIDIREKNNLVN